MRKPIAALVVTSALAVVRPGPGAAEDPDAPAGVPQIMTLEGRYVRVAYNNEGYAIIGDRRSTVGIGEPWILLEVGFALRDGVPNYDMTRDALDRDPGGKRSRSRRTRSTKANLQALQAREKVQRDSIDFPPTPTRPAGSAFAELDQQAMSWDKVEMSDQRACLGRLFFPCRAVQYGQYWLNVKFEKSVVRVPFRDPDEEEEKLLDKNFKDIKEQVDDAFKKKG